MAPKKKQQKKNNPNTRGSSSSSNAKTQSSDAKPAPKVQLSAESELRLRRLLLNTERPAAAPAKPPDASISQRAKRLRGVYDKLSLEGFTSDQIERAFASLKEETEFESALDWLCLNLPGEELPTKFTRGVTYITTNVSERAVKIISTAHDEWVPSQRPLDNTDELHGFSIRRKGHTTESLDFGKPSQSDWIKQYMDQQESEEEEEENEDDESQEANPMFCEAAIVEEYRLARLGALEAKERGDRKSQQHFSEIIRKMRQKMACLGLSDNILLSTSQERATSLFNPTPDSPGKTDLGVYFGSAPMKMQPEIDDNSEDLQSEKKTVCCNDNLDVHGSLRSMEVKQEHGELQLGNLFFEDTSCSPSLSLELLKPQRRKKSSKISYGHVFLDINEIWRKGESKMIPKAVLQKLCQLLGWDAPKYDKLSEKENKLLYNVSILRPASGRGKGRKAGGLITIELPNKFTPFGSVEVAQNTVAAFALCHLFPDAPFDQLLIEPYSSFIQSLDEELIDADMKEETRRSDFVNSLLEVQAAPLLTSIHSSVHSECPADTCGLKDTWSCFSSRKTERFDRHKQAESNFLMQEQEEKKKMPKYMKFLEARAALPMFYMKDKLLELLRMQDVIVVCGETGSGKTTQVPQFILDDMIASSMGGYCNIICTQPRRIAAISVAERVSDERCEPRPGLAGSIVGYQVRLESSRNQSTKLLFCTTGILLRKLTSDKDLSGVTHVIVDEVHERSLMGDFLMIILKSLIKRRSASGSNLKVILMSATMESNLFSMYFDNCPIVTAKGRTHPVETLYLEDIYEKLGYCLPSDSPAFGRNPVTRRGKVSENSIDKSRGKRNMVLSGWGDEALLDEDYINPHYVASIYGSYSERTCQNLRKLNEDVIDFDLLEDIISFIDDNFPDGAVLVFLPGIAEINMLLDRLLVTYRFSGSSEWVLPLHSSLASAEQRKAFLLPPQGIRKVIIATDIAETSITIDDVVYVIDTGKHKEKRYNPQTKMSSMVEDWISRANAKQRRGRAGRVKPGMCFCLYTRHRFESLLRPFQVPEILRVPLTELCLQVKALSLGSAYSFLLKAIEPPSHDAISSAISLLYEVGAIEGDEELSPLGYHLAKLPVDVLIGKMMIYGAIFGCLSPILTVAASLSYKLPFLNPKDEKLNIERAKQLLLSEKFDFQVDTNSSMKQSDHLLLVIAYDKWSRALREGGPKAAQQFCHSFFLSNPVMYMIREMRIQFGYLLADIGLVNIPSTSESGDKVKDKLDSWFADVSQAFNMYSSHLPIVKSILCAGLYPNVAASSEGIYGTSLFNNQTSCSGRSPAWYDGKREVHIHPSSVNFGVKHFQYPFMIFLEKVETTKIFLRDTTIVSPYAILLFGGSINVQHQMGTVIIDGWLKLAAPAAIAVLFKELRLTLQALLKELIKKPEVALVVKNEMLRSIVQLLLEEDKNVGQ